MSYDISFRVKVEGVDRYTPLPLYSCVTNITWNVRNIITESTGLEWKNCENNGLCSEIVPVIEGGLYELLRNGDKYKKYESPNGWGTVRGVINSFIDIINAYRELCTEDKELASVATFWIT